MARGEETRTDGAAHGRPRIPLQGTAATLNDRYGLYLSPPQERGFAVALLVGATVASALLVWASLNAARRARG